MQYVLDLDPLHVISTHESCQVVFYKFLVLLKPFLAKKRYLFGVYSLLFQTCEQFACVVGGR